MNILIHEKNKSAIQLLLDEVEDKCWKRVVVTYDNLTYMVEQIEEYIYAINSIKKRWEGVRIVVSPFAGRYSRKFRYEVRGTKFDITKTKAGWVLSSLRREGVDGDKTLRIPDNYPQDVDAFYKELLKNKYLMTKRPIANPNQSITIHSLTKVLPSIEVCSFGTSSDVGSIVIDGVPYSNFCGDGGNKVKVCLCDGDAFRHANLVTKRQVYHSECPIHIEKFEDPRTIKVATYDCHPEAEYVTIKDVVGFVIWEYTLKVFVTYNSGDNIELVKNEQVHPNS